jgi:ADP-heptose:LPS heptosyltransferase
LNQVASATQDLSNLGTKLHKNLPEKQTHIAVMRLSAMGDVAMTVPVLRALLQQHPEVKITVVSRSYFQPLFQDIPNLIFFPFDAESRHKGFLGLLQLYRDLKPLQIDAFADLHNVLRSKIVRTFFLWSGKKVAFTDKARAEKKALTRLEKKTINRLPTVFERHANVFKELGFPINLSQPTFPAKPKLDTPVMNIIGDEQKILIGIAPFAQYDSKVYPLDLMKEVVSELSKNKAYRLLLFGSKNEIQALQEISNNLDNTIVVAGKLRFSEELQLIAGLNVMLSMDSGNAHLAAIYGVPVVTLWGATHPFAGFSPFHQPLENCLTSDREQFPFLPTSVYGNKKVAGYEEAMRTISVESILSKINVTVK